MQRAFWKTAHGLTSSLIAKIRISKGSGTSVQDINKLLKQFKKMSQMMKKVGNNRELESLMKSGQTGDISSILNKNKPF